MSVSNWQLDHKVLPQLNLDIVSLLHVWHGCLGRATTRTSLQALQPWILTRGRPAQECTIYVRVYKQVCEIKDFRLSMSCSFIHSETPLQQGIVFLANLPGIIDARQVLSLTTDSVHGSIWGNQTLAQETSGNLFLSGVFRCIVTLVRGLCFGSPPRWHHDVCTRRAVSKAPPRLPWPGEACILGNTRCTDLQYIFHHFSLFHLVPTNKRHCLLSSHRLSEQYVTFTAARHVDAQVTANEMCTNCWCWALLGTSYSIAQDGCDTSYILLHINPEW